PRVGGEVTQAVQPPRRLGTAACTARAPSSAWVTVSSRAVSPLSDEDCPAARDRRGGRHRQPPATSAQGAGGCATGPVSRRPASTRTWRDRWPSATLPRLPDAVPPRAVLRLRGSTVQSC